MAMSRPTALAYLVGRITRLGMVRVQFLDSSYSTMVQTQMSKQSTARAMELLEGQPNNQAIFQYSAQGAGSVHKHQIGENISRKDKISFLVSTLVDLNNSKEAVYGALDAWVAWEQNFPIASLKRVLLALEKEQQWHRIVQLFRGLEAFDRKPEKSAVQKVANAYEMLGLLDEQKRVLEKYNDLFTERGKGFPKKSRKALSKKKAKSGQKEHASNSDGPTKVVDGIQTS